MNLEILSLQWIYDFAQENNQVPMRRRKKTPDL